ncbi:ABC transporter ATP-binding protein [Pontibacter vulgaris]|uniref:ABC transporter ATP-binding protein n=1 Tax=Pontibacter vulgaris TaxID=2905679 RepID=UPI001FA7DBB0|nr:ABC transporter ATP-binding protein [Pontibacter vulgaris]
MSTVIKVENLSKQYRLGELGTGTISHDLNRWWHKVRGKEDPYLKIGEVNDRSAKATSEYAWALRNINFEVKQGEVLGIIGKNGAGKSTLLKLLSRVTAPTTGAIKVKGRIASLLEVGTGFHEELTGRENIFLNGAILGMTKAEIRAKFDEIVAFSGTERYIDTPVKRYSSGMRVRLAFAVAAHLEPEILIVDEVLAVGDSEFQKKALGKMQDVSLKEGRTILFVSHNLAAIKQLCSYGILLKNGELNFEGNIPDILEKYQTTNIIKENDGVRHTIPDTGKGYFRKWIIKKVSENNVSDNFSIFTGEQLTFSFHFTSYTSLENVELGLVVRDTSDYIIYSTNSRDYGGNFFKIEKGDYIFDINTRLAIRAGQYSIDIILVSNNIVIDQWLSYTPLNVLNNYSSVLGGKWQGIICEASSFNYEKEN